LLAAAGESQSASGLKTDRQRSTLISLIFGLDNGEYLNSRNGKSRKTLKGDQEKLGDENNLNNLGTEKPFYSVHAKESHKTLC
jgi:hypothetical protein